MTLLDEWRRFARCLDSVPPSVFYPPESDPYLEEQAKAICRECPVRLACLDYALSIREWDGIWGGTTGDERRKLHRQRRRAAARHAATIDAGQVSLL